MPEERITAWLRIRDRLRFKAGMRGAAQDVEQLGQEAIKTSEDLWVMNTATGNMIRQSTIAAAALKLEAAAIDDVGDEANTTSRKLAFLSLMQNRSTLNLRKSLTSWRFWKDRLSLTRGEIMSTAITLAAYLSPAIVAMASSATAAALGGLAVLTSAVGVLGVGLGGTALAAITLSGQMNKVKTAQDAYNLAIEQYGAGSAEAARAAGKLYAVIRQNGGRDTWRAVRSVQALKDAWAKDTRPARGSLLGILMGGIRSAQNIEPTFARQTNLNAAATQRGMGNIFGALSGREAKLTLRVLSQTFRLIAGPATRGGANVIIVMMRIMRAAAPWVVRAAIAWESTTKSWKRGTRDAGKLSGTIDTLVGHLQSWWGLLKALGVTATLVFAGTNREGQKLVDVITVYITEFNNWLRIQENSGGLELLMQQYMRSLGGIATALGVLFSDPSRFIDKYLPIWLSHAGTLAGHVIIAFLRAWWNSNLWSKLFIASMVTKFLFGANLFGLLARFMGARFVAAFGTFIAPRLAAAFAAEGVIGSSLVGAGSRIGTAFGRAFVAGAVIGLVLLAPAIDEQLRKIGGQKGEDKTDFFWQGDFWKNAPGKIWKPFGNLGKNLLDPEHLFHAAGGLIPMGAPGIVGERGPELAVAGPSGTMIHPMGNGMQQPSRSSLAVSDLLPPVHVHVEVDRREVGRANVNWNDDRKALRGEH